MRGSGRFTTRKSPTELLAERLNPLHCGAVVASRRRCRVRPGARVSIPFIAGQWSLQGEQEAARAAAAAVSIPFIAGQWSLRTPTPPRSSWRAGLNPLHCGAVVASAPRPRRRPGDVGVSIPFIAGQWSLPALLAAEADDGAVSIPFIAGQWSLPVARPRSTSMSAGLNPLHCGAVVASGVAPPRRFVAGGTSIPFIAGQWSLPGVRVSTAKAKKTRLNPLHCGAVVASRPNLTPRRFSSASSIPFIAGQWSLPRADEQPRPGALRPQSPSLRGSGRFPPGRAGARRGRCGLNPLHCGAVVASPAPPPIASYHDPTSIPFIAGQWSLPELAIYAVRGMASPQSPSLRGSGRFESTSPSASPSVRFQSPSLRGSGRFSSSRRWRSSPPRSFQSPSLRGSGRFRENPVKLSNTFLMFQSPSLRGSGRFASPKGGGARRTTCFNPLHCGAVVASL